MSWSPRRGMVLAAGLGLRMRPLTDALPKPLVPVAGKPLIDHVLDRLDAAGVTDVVVNVHHLAERLEGHLAQRTRPRIAISDERAALLDSGGGVKQALPLLGPEPFFVHNADSIWIEGVGRNLVRLAEAWDDALMDGVLLLAPVVASSGYKGAGDFMLSPDGRLRRRQEREVAPFVFAGVSILHPRLFEDTPDGPFSLNRPWDAAIARGRLHGVRLQGRWMHVGDPAAIGEAEHWLAAEHD